MSSSSLESALERASGSRDARSFPSRSDERFRSGVLFPSFKPKFPLKFNADTKIFTIGSCFARNIEEALEPLGVNLPTRSFSVPKSEWVARPNALLNEFNPGSISTRITNALNGIEDSLDTIVETSDGCADLLLLGGPNVSFSRVVARRAEIRDVYQHIHSSDVVIITLGFIEAWYDTVACRYLNRMPPLAVHKADQTRYVFRRLDVFDAYPLLERAIISLGQHGIKVLLSVSPVPLQTTFSGEDCVSANEFSKSVLRVCAQRLYQAFPHVDYFPSYEIVRSGGLSLFLEDNIHVRNEVVVEILSYMIRCYSDLDQNLQQK